MFGPLWWDETWYSRHHLTAGLAKRWRVVHVQEPVSLRAALKSPSRLLDPGGLHPGEVGLEEYVPPGRLPHVHRWPALVRWLQARRARRLQATLADAGMPDPLYYVWNPMYRPSVEALSDPTLVYHAYDKYDQYEGSGERTTRAEAWLARRARLCIAASTELGEYLTSLGAAEVAVVHHGVDAELFRPDLPEPEALAAIPRPRLGIVARLNEVLDTRTLRYLAEQRPDWSIVLVGGLYFSDDEKLRTFHDLAALDNVHHVGLQPRTQVPNWLAGFDAGLICYDLETWGPYNQPIKMYEYLACGLPVVSTGITAARELGEDLVKCANEPEEWLQAVETALGEDSEEDVGRRLEYARASGWEHRVEELAQHLARVAAS
jgi:glycosyltransferase involved in cell wall biosynthesis